MFRRLPLTLGALGLLVLGATGCGGSASPTTPTPPDGSSSVPLALTCPLPVSVPATSSVGTVVSYPPVAVTGGRAPVAVTCTPAAGAPFTVGTTEVRCTGTDRAGQSTSCAFAVTVTPVPRLSRASFLAFGDSVTAGELTFPVPVVPASGGMRRHIVVPAAAYPTRLQVRLSERYLLQTVSVVNAGNPGEAAEDAVPRFLDAMRVNQPQVVLLLMGYNDLAGGARGVRRGLSALERMAKEARGRGARLFLATLTPPVPGRQRAEPEDLVRTFNSGVRALALGENAVLVDLYEALLPSAGLWIGPDGLHPSEEGYERVAELFFDAIRLDLEER